MTRLPIVLAVLTATASGPDWTALSASSTAPRLPETARPPRQRRAGGQDRPVPAHPG